MNTEEIKELIELISKKRKEIDVLKAQLRSKELEGCDYEGKFIEMPDYGRMYVTWQKLDESNAIYNDARMFFQGLGYNIELCDYRDMSNFFYSALHEWYVPLDTFKNWFNSGKIKEITESEFIDGFTKEVARLVDEFKGHLLGCKDAIDRKKKEQ